MADIIQLSERRRHAYSGHIVRKFIDGEFVEFVDFDALSLSQQKELLDTNTKRVCE
jgi:hypothetical protein